MKWLFLYLLLTILISPCSLFSDMAPDVFSPPANAVMLYSNNDIAMNDEVINMRMFADHYDVDVIYNFSNTGKDQDVTVAFPSEYLLSWLRHNDSPLMNFHTYENGKEIKVYEITNTDYDNIRDNLLTREVIKNLYRIYECSLLFFKENEEKQIRNTYSQVYQEPYFPKENWKPDMIEADYILNTGGYWKGIIRSIKLNAYLNDGFQERFIYDQPWNLEHSPFKSDIEVSPTNYKIENNAIKMNFEDIKPDFDIKITLPRYLYKGISASSEKKDKDYNYSASNVIDDNPGTAWVPEDKTQYGIFHKDGINENITLVIGDSFGGDLESSILINKIGIINGLAASTNLFYANNRVKKIKISYSSIIADRGVNKFVQYKREFNEIYNLKDTMSMQYFKFNKPVLASTIQFTILDIYRGTKYPHDTCISEIKIITEKTNSNIGLTMHDFNNLLQ